MKDKIIEINEIPGVGSVTAEKLQGAGFCTLMSLAVASPKNISELTGVSEVVARKMINTARDNCDLEFKNADEVMENQKSIHRISTGLEKFDTLLGGGLESKSIVEFFGEFGSGKTQMSHLLCTNTLKQFPGCCVVYIDTENTFRPGRIVDFCDGVGIDKDDALKRIKVARSYNTDHMMMLVENVKKMISEDKLDIKLIVIDSLTAHFRAEFCGREELARRQQKLNKLLLNLHLISDINNLVVYITNQVYSKPDVSFGDPIIPVGGHVLGHGSTTRVYLRKGKKGSRVAKLIDSPDMPDGEVCFYVEKNKLIDA